MTTDEQPTDQIDDEQPTDEQPTDEQPTDEQPTDEQPEPILDLTRIDLSTLLLAEDTVLTNAVRRVLAELETPDEIIAAFGNAP